jgi:hypothetical protein
MTKKVTPNLFCRVTDTHTHRQRFNQYSGISSHSFGCSYRLAVLSQLSKSVYGAPQTILRSLLTRMQFNGDSQYKTHDYFLWRATKYLANESLLTWSCKLDNGRQYVIKNLHHHPLQFNLGELSTMSTIHDTKGEGWNKVPNIERDICSDNPHDDNIAQAPITTSHQYKENMILLMTVFEIKKIILGKNMQKFWMRCSVKNYERGNNDVRKRHSTLFKDKKDHYYSFGPSDELVQTLQFEFVANLKGGAYTRLPSKWMSNVRSKLNQSQRNLITSIQLVRSLRPSDKNLITSIQLVRSLRPSNNLGGIFPLTVEPDKNTRYIYKVFMEKSICL